MKLKTEDLTEEHYKLKEQVLRYDKEMIEMKKMKELKKKKNKSLEELINKIRKK